MIFLLWIRKDTFLASAGVAEFTEHVSHALRAERGTLADTFGRRMLNCLVAGLLDVRADWQTFFADEFDTIDAYLRSLHGLDASAAAVLIERSLLLGPLVVGRADRSADRQMTDLMESPTGKRMLNQFLTVLQVKNEAES